MAARQGIQKRVPAHPDQVAGLRRVVREFAETRCGLGDDLAGMIALAVTEACANVVLHAYPDDGAGDILLTARAVDGFLVVEVGDDGVGMNNGSVTPGLGLGLTIMRQLADARISSDTGGTRVELWFPCGSA